MVRSNLDNLIMAKRMELINWSSQMVGAPMEASKMASLKDMGQKDIMSKFIVQTDILKKKYSWVNSRMTNITAME